MQKAIATFLNWV